MALTQSHILENVVNMRINPEHSFQEESIIIEIGLQSPKLRHFSKLCITLRLFLLFLKSNALDSIYLLSMFFCILVRKFLSFLRFF